MGGKHYEKVPGMRGQEAFNPQKEAGVSSTLTFHWMNGIFRTGNKRALEESDFLPLQDDDDTKRLTERIQRNWRVECKTRAVSGSEPRFWKAVLASIPRRSCAVLLWSGVIDAVCRFLQPLLLGFLLLNMESAQDVEYYSACELAAAMFLNALVRITANHCFIYHCERIGMQLRAAIKGAVFLKVSA